MAFDPISWALGFVLSHGANSVLRQFRTDDLAQKLNQAVEEWAAALPAALRDLQPESLFDIAASSDPEHVATDNTPESRAALGQGITDKHIPSARLWQEALLEQWDEITQQQPTSALQAFFQLDRTLAAGHLDDLSVKLHQVCAIDTELFRYTTTARLEALVAATQEDDTLTLPNLEWDRDQAPPGALLRAEYAIVPFRGREQALADLENWALSEASIGIRLYAGWGGFGKTRLALELCKRLRTEGVQAGFLVRENAEHRITWIHTQLTQEQARLFLVIDYVESDRDVLINLLRKIHPAQGGHIRIMLLARGIGEWWEELKKEGDGVGELLSSQATSPPMQLESLALSIEERSDSYRQAAQAFAHILRRTVPDTSQVDFDAPYFERVLLLHMAALNKVDGVEVKGADGTLDVVLRREQRFWERLLRSRELSSDLIQGLDSAMAVFTLIDGVSTQEEAIDILQKIPFFEEEKWRILDLISQLLHDSYGGKKWIEPLQPDLLGEHLIEKVLERHGEVIFEQVL